MNILITGGAGYIGSHTTLECLLSGHQVVVFDNLSNSSEEPLRRITRITGKSAKFIQGDLLNKDQLHRLFQDHSFDAVIHFAGLKSVGESCEKPMLYQQNNIIGSTLLLNAMLEAKVPHFIFSSSATVYGNPKTVPIDENAALAPTNPYGTTKMLVEYIAKDLALFQKNFKVICLRYFNPIGAHASGEIGENPRGIPNNLVPYLTQVAAKQRPFLSIFGNDYDTPDGTGVRDYIHVVDLAKGHLAVLENLEKLPAFSIYNLGTGLGHSVLELIHTFEAVTQIKVPYRFVERRPGDIATAYASVKKAAAELNWQAQHSLVDMLEDAWRWQSHHPTGYGS